MQDSQISMSPEEKKYVEENYRYYVLKSFFNKCISNYHSSFMVIKAAYMTLPTRIEHHLDIVERVLKHAVNRKKKMFFGELERNQGEKGYWKSKGCVLIEGLLNKKVNEHAFIIFKAICKVRLEMKDNQIGLFQKKQIKSSFEPKLIYQSFTLEIKSLFAIVGSIKKKVQSKAFYSLVFQANKSKKNIKEISEIPKKTVGAVINISSLINNHVKTQYLTFFLLISNHEEKHIRHSNEEQFKKSPILSLKHEEQSEIFVAKANFETDIKISQIKSIVMSNLAFNSLPLSPSKKNSASSLAQRSIQIISEIVSHHKKSQSSQAFRKILWKSVEGYHEEMIENLRAEIEVLQNEFDSL